MLMYRALLIAALSNTCGMSHAAGRAAMQPANARVLAAVHNILTNAQSSRYSHKTTVDVEEGVYELDCSGLARILLLKAAPAALKELPVENGQHRPLAISFYNTFTNAARPAKGHWKEVARLAEAGPGDFIAWRKQIQVPGKTTGHVVILMSKPVREQDGSFRVKVFDSSSTPHAQDSRMNSTGIGTGTMWFLVDDSGKPAAFHWSAKPGKPTYCPIAIGQAGY